MFIINRVNRGDVWKDKACYNHSTPTEKILNLENLDRILTEVSY